MRRRDFAPLLAAVLEAPDDDAPRSVLADWWLEQDDPRGELFGLQCAWQRKLPTTAQIANLLSFANRRAYSVTTRSKTARLDDNWRHIEALLEQHSMAWTADLAGDVPGAFHGFWHGFVEALSIDAADFVPRMDRIFAAAPIRYLRLRRLTRFTARAIADHPAMSRVKLLATDKSMSAATAAVLAGAANLSGVKRPTR